MRFLLGFLCGVLLAFEAFLLTGAGHGTYAPLIFASSILSLLSPFFAIGTPVLWGLYFVLVPVAETRPKIVALALILVAHFLPGIWLAVTDPAFAHSSPLGLLLFFASLAATFGVLLFLCFARRCRE